MPPDRSYLTKMITIMTSYSTNITLHDAFAGDYKVLESELRQLSFLPAGTSVWKFKKPDLPLEKAALFAGKGDGMQEVDRNQDLRPG